MKLFNSKGFVWSPQFGATIISVLVLVAIPTTLYLTNRQQDVRQQAAPTSEATISVDPKEGIYGVGQKFVVNVLIDGGSVEFDAAKATVGVSPNLAIESIAVTPENAGGCNFSFTDPTTIPTKENPSFSGILPSKSSVLCSIYTLTLIPTEQGIASVFITDGAVQSKATGQNMLQETVSATFTITP